MMKAADDKEFRKKISKSRIMEIICDPIFAAVRNLLFQGRYFQMGNAQKFGGFDHC